MKRTATPWKREILVALAFKLPCHGKIVKFFSVSDILLGVV